MPKSKNQMIKDGWGSRTNFQLSYGLKMTPEDLEEGQAILDALWKSMKEDEKEDEKEGKRKKAKETSKMAGSGEKPSGCGAGKVQK